MVVRFHHPQPIIRSVAQPGSAPGLGPGGPRFESLYSDHFYRQRDLEVREVLYTF